MIVLPITNKDDIWEFDDMDAAEISIADAPRDDEMLIALALAIGGRPLHRVRKPS
ncbi:MAG: amino acid synthesis family protein [Microbacterium sp.]|uniref:amino acid synthesis family protein n=1 Tax=Microbacterium sp. TaxID=51671 RepID=UPI0039E44C37